MPEHRKQRILFTLADAAGNLAVITPLLEGTPLHDHAKQLLAEIRHFRYEVAELPVEKAKAS
jgi:uncharacterized protein YhdP